MKKDSGNKEQRKTETQKEKIDRKEERRLKLLRLQGSRWTYFIRPGRGSESLWKMMNSGLPSRSF